jgi:hypothetical protein
MRWIGCTIIVLVLIAAIFGGFVAYQAITASAHAEHVLHAALLTIELLHDHVTLHDGKWPRGWSDLEDLRPRRWAMFHWPEDSSRVQQYVQVDFSADPQRIAEQSVEEFDAVRPIGPYYSFKDRGGVEALLKTLRERAANR